MVNCLRQRVETQPSYFVCAANRRLCVAGFAIRETTTAVETSRRDARQQVRQVDISPRVVSTIDTNCVYHGISQRSQIWWLGRKEARRRVEAGSRVSRERSTRSAASSFCALLPSPEAIARNQLRPSLLLPTFISISCNFLPISSRSQQRVGVSPCTCPPLSPICRGGGSSLRIDGPI